MMPFVKTQHATNMRMDLVKSTWESIRAHLENERVRVHVQITKYPPPIPACDADFNHLLEKRARISAELSRMQVAAKESVSPGDSIKLIDEFVSSSSCIDEEAKRKIRSALNENSDQPETR